MISERFMATGKDIKTGETICGFPVRRKSRFSELESMLIEDEYRTTRIVDPESIAPLPVSVLFGENGNAYCPNCRIKIGIFHGRNYCTDCGQRLEWEEKE
jgi:hypothetical protein